MRKRCRERRMSKTVKDREGGEREGKQGGKRDGNRDGKRDVWLTRCWARQALGSHAPLPSKIRHLSLCRSHSLSCCDTRGTWHYHRGTPRNHLYISLSLSLSTFFSLPLYRQIKNHLLSPHSSLCWFHCFSLLFILSGFLSYFVSF